MHLDCVFSILSDNVCLMLKEMMGEDSPTKRLVDEYSQDVITGQWTHTRKRIEFTSYMRDNGFHIIEIEGADQLVSFSELIHDNVSGPIHFVTFHDGKLHCITMQVPRPDIAL